MKPTRSQLDSMLASHPPSELLTPGVFFLKFADTPPFSPDVAPRFPQMSEINSL